MVSPAFAASTALSPALRPPLFAATSPTLPLQPTTPTCAPTRRAPRMLEQNTIIAATTAFGGLGAGLALVAWTENQGVRTTRRTNVQTCVVCKGEKTVVCNVCNGSKTDPLDPTKACSYCDGAGVIKCFNCGGTGIQPRFLDRLSPDDFMD